jgi:acetylornithine deacetylase/succinyl-diaminopimelate desuccinylase-like protein
MTSPHLDQVLDTLDQDLDASLARLFEWLRIPSISTDPAFAPHCRTAATWLKGELDGLGIDSSLRETPGHRSWSVTRSATVRTGRMCCSTVTTTCSPSTRSTCGRRRPSSRASPPCRTAAR